MEANLDYRVRPCLEKVKEAGAWLSPRTAEGTGLGGAGARWGVEGRSDPEGVRPCTVASDLSRALAVVSTACAAGGAGAPRRTQRRRGPSPVWTVSLSSSALGPGTLKDQPEHPAALGIPGPPEVCLAHSPFLPPLSCELSASVSPFLQAPCRPFSIATSSLASVCFGSLVRNTTNHLWPR